MGSRAVIGTTLLCQNITTTGAQGGQTNIADYKTYQAQGNTTAGAGAATILIQGSNNDVNWDTIGTITLTLATTTASDSFTSTDRYRKVRANISALSGTGASISATVGW